MNDPNPLRQRIARAIHRYDNQNALSGNDIPSKHHQGEADFVLAELRLELNQLAALRAVTRGYCPACGRGDAAPTVQDWEQQRQRADQAEDLLRIAHDTSNKSEAERARAVQRAERAEAERDHLAAAASPADVAVRAIQLMQETGRERDAALAAHREAQAERDGAYRERAHLLALVAAMTGNAVIAPAADVDEPGWQIVYLTIGGRQASWHISPRDSDLFQHVEHVDGDLDPRAIWDGHTTAQKYDRIADHIAHRWFVPPAKYVRSGGVKTCPHTIPVGPDSCWDCRDLADLDEPKEG